MKRKLLLGGLITAAGGAVGLALFVLSGVYNVAASAGHFRITAWLLEVGMRSSVRTHALGISAPPLDDPALIERAVGHFHSGCAPCHGAPGIHPSPVTRQMLPHPPDLAQAVATWRPEQLFWIVKHGLKYTGMPAWPTQRRDDEVWAMVAFLQRLPGLSAQDYRKLALPERSLDDPPVTIGMGRLAGLEAIACARCHGAQGRGSAAGGVPRLAGQRAGYLLMTLQDYETGARPSGVMHPVAIALSDDEKRQVAEYYASVRAPDIAAGEPEKDAAQLLARGASLAQHGERASAIPACESCHGPQGRARDKYPNYPALAGQHRDYLERQLRLFRAGTRGGSFGPIMAAAVRNITEEQIRAVSLYYAQLPAGN